MSLTDITSVPLYELRGVDKIYGQGGAQVHALRGLSLTIESGEFVAVVGPSGSGKTTCFSCSARSTGPQPGRSSSKAATSRA